MIIQITALLGYHPVERGDYSITFIASYDAHFFFDNLKALSHLNV